MLVRGIGGHAYGWFEKAAILIQLLKDEQFEKAKETAEHFESSCPAMQHALLSKVLDKKQQQQPVWP